jgi:formate dehydrogenase (NADP+) alpha subunit
METITIRIDDQDIAVPQGVTILEAALANKIFIPHLCYHPDLKPAGACRVCVVELADGQLVTSCRTPVKDGMTIKTKSTGVERVRRPVIEMIIANHHMDCKDCLKKGQCVLQKIMAYMKIDKKRLRENMRLPKVELPPDESNPFFMRDHNKCVLCGICVRTCQQIASIHAIDFSGRGNNAKISTFGDKPLAGSICTSCGECVVRCPVGALAVKKPRRPEKEVKTICPYCSVGCGIYLGIRDGFLVHVRGDSERPVNQGHLCVKGRYGLDFIHSPDRLTSPLLRQKKSKALFKEATWIEALTVVANTLKKYRGDEIAVIASAGGTNEDHYIAQKFARVVLGTNNIDTSVRLCDAPTIAALNGANSIGVLAPQIMEGIAGEKADLATAGCILVIGADVTASHPVMGLRIKKAVVNGARLIVISSKETELCRYAHVWMNPYPGTDLALIMGICSVIVDEDLHDKARIEKLADNFPDFRESLADFPSGRVERITGVSRDKVEEAARICAGIKPLSLIWGEGITQYSQGTGNVLSLINLSLLTGNTELAASLKPVWRENNTAGASFTGCLPDFYPGYQSVADAATRKKFEKAWGKSLNPKPGLTYTEILDATREGKIKALYIIGNDPAANSAPPRKVKEAFKKAKFIVCQDMFMSETAKSAHVILPAASFAEKEGTFTNTEKLVQNIHKAIEPAGNSKPDWQIFCELAGILQYDGFGFNSATEIMSEISAVAAGGAVEKNRFRFMPLQYQPPAEVTDIDYPLILTAERDVYSVGSLSAQVEGLEMLRTKDYVYINPKDAADSEVEDGSVVKVISRHGEIKKIAKLTDAVPCGLISLCEEEEMNQLVHPALDPVARTPEMKICAVKILKKRK